MPLLPLRNDIRCCNRHNDYPTPVIGTCKFPKSEFWCPHCGAKYELFDGFKYYPITYKLNLRLQIFYKLATDYLSDKTEEYKFYERPDAIFGLMLDADIAWTLRSLGFIHNAVDDLKEGAVFYTLNKKKITVVAQEEFLFIESEEGKRKPICDIKGFDLALLPEPTIAADFFIKSMNR